MILTFGVQQRYMKGMKKFIDSNEAGDWTKVIKSYGNRLTLSTGSVSNPLSEMHC